MAVFTAIAAAITGAITGAGFAAAFAAAGTLTGLGIATSLLAGGLAIATAKALGPDVPSIQAQKDPGVKVQLDPSTDNRVPVFYGRVFTGAIAVDAQIKNQNNTMVYVMVIGEKTDTGTYSVNDIYRGDAKLNFTNNIVTSITDPNATSSTNVNGKMRCRVYAGNAQSSANQIFPTTGTPVAAQTLVTTIDTTTNYEDLVYAIFEVDYDPENGLTGLGTLTFDIQNSLNSPANVLYDYMTNDRYGAGIPVSSIDTDSIDDMWEASNILGTYGNVEYTTTANVSAYHSKWQIDGMLSTYQPVKQNIDRICTSSSTFFTYDPKGGKFKVVPNREATTAEKANAFVFNNNNIVSKIEIGSTELYSLYNSIEAEYPAVNQKDQTSTVLVETPAGDRQANEPDNGLNIRYNLINDAPRAKNLANIDLRQSRFDTVVTFDADYSAIQVDVGDIVKVTESTYGFSDKLFRVMRVTEQEDEAGMLTVKVVGLEYDDSVYTHEVVKSLAPENAPGIPNWWTGIWGNVDYSNISNIIGNIVIIDDPLGGNANVVDDTGNVVGNVTIGDSNIVYPPFDGPGGPIINVPITIPEIPDITTICTNLHNMKIAGTLPANVDFGHICVDHVPPDGNATFPPGGNVTVPIPIPEPPTTDPTNPITPIIPDYEIDLDIWFSNDNGNQTPVSTVPGIPITYRGGVQTFGAVQTGVQEEESAANLAMANADTFVGNIDLGDANSIIVPVTSISLGAVDEGVFTATNNFIPFGGAQTNGTLAYAALRQVEYKEYDIDPTTGKYTPSANSDIFEQFSGNGFYTQFSNETPPTNISDNFEYEVSRDRGSALAVSLGLPPASATKAYLANNLNVVHYANSNLTNVGVRGASVTNQDKRITKGDDYIQLF